MNAIDGAGKCAFCGNFHGVRCPEVRAVEYHQDGSVKRVEFMTMRDYNPIAAVAAMPWRPPGTWAIGGCGEEVTAIQTGAPT